jgi:hypothetical protein
VTAKRIVQGWDEQDVFTGWRRFYGFRPGQIRRIKRRYHKKERRQGRREASEQATGTDQAR